MTDTNSGVVERFGDDFFLVQPFDRDLECEHRDVKEDGSLEPCKLEADFAVVTPMWSDVTRTRRCSVHIWNEVERHLDTGTDQP